MQELWEMWSICSLPSLPGPIWSGVVAPDRALFMGRIELNRGFEYLLVFFFFVFKQRIYVKLVCLERKSFDI